MSLRDTPWYTEEGGFFGPGYLLEYEKVLPQERTVKEVDFLLKVLKPKVPSLILDMPCGHGRHSVELSSRGYYDVVGVDINAFFLAKAEEAAAKANVYPEFRKADMRTVEFPEFDKNLGEGFDYALNMFTAIGYFGNDDDDQRVFDVFYSSLKRGGLFFFDFLNRDRLMRAFRKQDWRELSDGSLLCVERSHDMLTGTNTDRRIIVSPDGQRCIQEGHTCRMYSALELVQMGKRSGFKLKESFGDFDGSPLTMDSQRVLLLFEKP